MSKDIRSFLVSRSLSRSSEQEWARLDELARQMEARAAEIGLPWPYHEQKKTSGRTSRRTHWHRALAAWVHETKGDTAWPESVTMEVPDWWRPGMNIERDVEKEFHDTFLAKMAPMAEKELATATQAELPTPLLTSQKSTDSLQSAATSEVNSSQGLAGHPEQTEEED